MESFQIRPSEQADSKWVTQLLVEEWGSPEIVTRGKIHHADKLPGLIAEKSGEPVGLLTYHIEGEDCEVVTMNSLITGIGIGSALLDDVKKVATIRCKRLWLITTNDNTDALAFYQKTGFTLVAVHRNAINESRKLKPEIPLTGNNGIPIRDEIELELVLK